MTKTEPQRRIKDVLDAIIFKNDGIRRFWSNALGWAPVEAAGLLSKSRLDWQVSLSHTLGIWLTPNADGAGPDADGRLILGWANLGSLVEGSLKRFLSVYYDDYKADIAAIHDRAGAVKDPDGLTLQSSRRVNRSGARTSQIFPGALQLANLGTKWWQAIDLHIESLREIGESVPPPSSEAELIETDAA